MWWLSKQEDLSGHQIFLSYAADHVSLLLLLSNIIWIRVGGDRLCRDAAETCRATAFWNCLVRCWLCILWNGGCPLVTCEVVIRWNISCWRCGRRIGGISFFLPLWKYHLLSVWSWMVPRLGFNVSGVKMVAGALCENHFGSWLNCWFKVLVGVTFGLYGLMRDSGRWRILEVSWRFMVYQSDSGGGKPRTLHGIYFDLFLGGWKNTVSLISYVGFWWGSASL